MVADAPWVAASVIEYGCAFRRERSVVSLCSAGTERKKSEMGGEMKRKRLYICREA